MISSLTSLFAPLLAQEDGGGALVAGGGLCLWAIVTIAVLAAVVWAIIDIVKRDFASDGEKIVWIVVVLLLGICGVIIYALFGRSRGTRKDV